MNVKIWLISATALFLAVAPLSAAAGPCDAYFTFDDTLADASGNGYDGEMIVKGGGLSTPAYTEGKFGSALMLDGNAAMRALLDLHYDACPQVTISAWINVSREAPNDSLHVLSTGGGSGPGLTISGTGLNLRGTENGIYQQNAIRKGAWMFVAGVYDYATGEYFLYGGGRTPTPGKLTEFRSEPQNAIWVGTVHDDWGNFARGVAIDDLRITGRRLDEPQITALRARTPTSSEPQTVPGDGAAGSDPGDINVDIDQPPDLVTPGISSDSVPLGIDDQGSPIFASDFVGPSCASQDDCTSSTYCGWDQMCHPEAHAPMQAFDPLFVPAATLTPLPEDKPTGLPRPVGAGILSRVSGEESKTTRTADLVNNFLVGFSWKESGDRPCELVIVGESEAMGSARIPHTLVGCGGGGGGDGTGLVQLRQPSDSDAVEPAIHRLEICSSDNNNKRMKGIEVRATGVDASANRVPSDLKSRYRLYPGCDTWRATSSCDSERVGTGVVIHYTRASGRNEQIVGLQLICRRIALENE